MGRSEAADRARFARMADHQATAEPVRQLVDVTARPVLIDGTTAPVFLGYLPRPPRRPPERPVVVFSWPGGI